MTNNPIQKLAKLLNDSDQPDWKRSAHALALAFAWNQDAIQLTKNNRTELLMALSELAKALAEGRESSAGIVAMIDEALPGPTLRDAVITENAHLSQRADRLITLQSEVAKLEQLEQKNLSLMSELNKLQERRNELAGLELFDPAAVEALRTQVLAVEEAKPWLSDMNKLKKRLEDDLPQLEVLSSEALMILQEKGRQELKRTQEDLIDIQAEARQQESALAKINQTIQTVRADINARQKGFADAENELRVRREILEQYIKVDQEIAMTIKNSEANGAQQLLDEIETRLHDVDKVLRLAIEANEKARKIQTMYL